jgi:hypothetical protein
MEINNFEDEKSFRNVNNKLASEKKIYFPYSKLRFLIIFILLISIINLIILILNNFHKKALEKIKIQEIMLKKKTKETKNKITNYVTKDLMPDLISNEINRISLKEINQKRTFEKRFPLPKEIDCKSHLTKNELVGLLSFFTKNTIYFETGSGCSSIMAKYYTKKSYAIEGCRFWYEKGIKNGLKENLIFHDLKPDNPNWSYPGKDSTLDDWKKYFQAYDSSYNADVILIDGRFKVATAMDIFDKIKDDTIVLIHEYQERPIYFIIENYYQYVYHWDRLTAFIKKKEIKSIPIEIQQKYWNKDSAL